MLIIVHLGHIAYYQVKYKHLQQLSICSFLNIPIKKEDKRLIINWQVIYLLDKCQHPTHKFNIWPYCIPLVVINLLLLISAFTTAPSVASPFHRKRRARLRLRA